MGAILGLLGFVLGLGSLWFTTEAVKRTDATSDAAIKPHLREIRARLAEARSLIQTQETRIAKLESELAAVKAVRKPPQAFEGGMAEAGYPLDKARDFRPSNVYNA